MSDQTNFIAFKTIPGQKPIFQQFHFEEHAKKCVQIWAWDIYTANTHLYGASPAAQLATQTSDMTPGREHAFVLQKIDSEEEPVRMWYTHGNMGSKPHTMHVVCVKKKGETRVEFYKPYTVARMITARYAYGWKTVHEAIAEGKGELEAYTTASAGLVFDPQVKCQVLHAETGEIMEVWFQEVTTNDKIMLK
jgi:hypothetical protein